MTTALKIALGLAVLAIVGCGNDGPAAPVATTAQESTIRNGAPDPWTEQQVIDALDLRTDSAHLNVEDRPARPDDLGPVTPTGCGVSVILTSARAIDLYAGAGDTVVTNPDGTAGVKTSNDQKCLRELQQGLAKLTR